MRINSTDGPVVLEYNFYVPEAGVYTFYETTADKGALDNNTGSDSTAVSPIDIRFDDGEWITLSGENTKGIENIFPAQATWKNEWLTPVLLDAGMHTVSFKVDVPSL